MNKKEWIRDVIIEHLKTSVKMDNKSALAAEQIMEILVEKDFGGNQLINILSTLFLFIKLQSEIKGIDGKEVVKQMFNQIFDRINNTTLFKEPFNDNASKKL